MKKVFLFKPSKGKTKHLAVPSSINDNEDVEFMVPYCGRFLRDKTDKEEYDSIEEAMKNQRICINCLASLGVIKSPKLKNEH